MKPASPVVPGYKLPETVFAKDQPQYMPLPALTFAGGTVLTRWRLTWRERVTLLFRGDLYLTLLTFNRPLQPVKIDTMCPLAKGDAELIEAMYLNPPEGA